MSAVIDAISLLASTAAAQPYTEDPIDDEEEEDDTINGRTSPTSAADRLLMQKINSEFMYMSIIVCF
jgi:hypothetical protein